MVIPKTLSGKAAAHSHLLQGMPLLFIHEAGRAGFWLPLRLRATGHEAVVSAARSVEKPRRKRAKGSRQNNLHRLQSSLGDLCPVLHRE